MTLFQRRKSLMLCKNCGKELPIAGKFCPFCGAAVEQTGVNDETAVFTTLPDDMKDPVAVSYTHLYLWDNIPFKKYNS